MTTGTVKFFNSDKGYGFIAPETGGPDAFVHISAVERAGMGTLDKDQRVTYELETDRPGKNSAVHLQSALTASDGASNGCPVSFQPSARCIGHRSDERSGGKEE